jgi:septal ring factor EnvC (AmiA/AmiB activator)
MCRQVRLPSSGVAATALLIASVLQAAAQTPSDPDAARRKLEADRRTLTETDKRAGDLQSEMVRVQKEREDLRARLLEVGRQIQASEALLTTIEKRRGELEAREAEKRRELEARRGSLSSLLAVMQRMGRNPPPVMITQRDDALAMVRSAMLVGAAFPELRTQAMRLAGELQEIVDLQAKVAEEQDKLRVATRQYSDESAALAALVEQRTRSAREHQKELERLQQASADIRRSVTDLAKLIERMEKAVADNTRLGAYERELARQAPPPADVPAPPGAQAPSSASAQAPNLPAAQAPTPPLVAAPTAAPTAAPPPAAPKAKPDDRTIITLAPPDRVAMANPGRLQPLIPFSQAKGRLPWPAQGKRVLAFGQRTQRGPFEGIAIETRHGAQVVSPSDGWVLYAGEFRTFAQVLIINAGGGYYVVLSGLSQIDVPVGQFVVAGEPVGTMPQAPRVAQAQTNQPVLYIEFRKDRTPIDPEPWWADPGKKNAWLAPRDGAVPQFARGHPQDLEHPG